MKTIKIIYQIFEEKPDEIITNVVDWGVFPSGALWYRAERKHSGTIILTQEKSYVRIINNLCWADAEELENDVS